MTIRITQVRKLLSQLEDMSESIMKEIEKLDIQDFTDKFNELKDGIEETIDDLNSKGRLTQQQEERLEQYDNLMEDLSNLSEDVDLLAELYDKVDSMKDLFESLSIEL